MKLTLLFIFFSEGMTTFSYINIAKFTPYCFPGKDYYYYGRGNN